MCGKLGENEIESMRNMMSMAVYSVLADIFNIDIDDISPDSNLWQGLLMTQAIQARLHSAIMDEFDNLSLDFKRIKTVQDIVNQVFDYNAIKTTAKELD